MRFEESGFDTPADKGLDDDNVHNDDIELGGSHYNNNDEKTSLSAKTNISSASSSATLPQIVAYSNVDEYYQDLGMDCAYHAHSVEIFGLVNEETTTDEKQRHSSSCSYFGFDCLDPSLPGMQVFLFLIFSCLVPISFAS